MRANLQRVRRNGDDGFTLIELLIVIIILGVLAAIVVFSVRGIADRGNTNACKTAVSTLNTAIEADVAQNDAHVATIGQLVTDGFIHPDSTYTTATGTTVTVGGKTITLTPYAPGPPVVPANASSGC